MDISEPKCYNQLKWNIVLIQKVKYIKDGVQDGRQLGL